MWKTAARDKGWNDLNVDDVIKAITGALECTRACKSSLVHISIPMAEDILRLLKQNRRIKDLMKNDEELLDILRGISDENDEEDSPVKAIWDEDEYFCRWLCGNCGAEIMFHNQKECRHCGRKILRER